MGVGSDNGGVDGGDGVDSGTLKVPMLVESLEDWFPGGWRHKGMSSRNHKSYLLLAVLWR